MTIVHRTRESQGEQNKLVYGLSPDSNEFQFWRLDNSSEVIYILYYNYILIR